jgi:hypothetical protein
MLGFPIMMRSIANSLTMPTIMMRSRFDENSRGPAFAL